MVAAAEQAKFTQGSLIGHISVMSLTASVGLMAIFLVDLVDMLFISMLGRDELAAAVGYAGALLFFTTSFGIGVAIAAGALVARALGAGDKALAVRRTASALIFGAVAAAVFAGAFLGYLDPLVSAVGASGVTHTMAVSYLSIVVPSLPLLVVGIVGGAVLRAHGAARLSMQSTIAAGLVNAALDPILIFGLDMELAGAAWASVAARATMAVTALVPIARRYGGLKMPGISGLAADLRPILGLAFPAILTQLATPVGQAYVTRAMAEFGEDAVAGMAVIARLTPVAFGVIFALSGAIGPVIGQNAGAGLNDRVRGAFRDGLLFTAAVVVVVTLILFVLRTPIADLFQATGTGRELVYLFCGPLALAFYFNGVIFVANAGFNNLGHPYYSTWVNWGRHTIGTIPFVIGGAILWGAPGVLIGQAMGGVIFAAISVWLAFVVFDRAERASPDKAPHFARHGRLMSLVHLRR